MASIFWFIVLIGILIFAHEGGHFLFAKAFNVRVLTFSLGFGKPIRIGRFKLSWQPGETEYRVAWFPAGGFVRMLGDDPTEEVAPENRSRAFSTQKAWKRFLIILGGPLFSILLAIPIFFVDNLVDDTVPDAEVGAVVPGSPAEVAGLQAGDVILSVDGHAVENWEHVLAAVQDSGGRSIEMQFERHGQGQKAVRLTPRQQLDETGLELLGEQWESGVLHVRQGWTVGVVPGSPAEQAGVQSYAQVRNVCGIPVRGWTDIQHLLEGNREHLVPVTAIQGASVEVGVVSIVMPMVLDTVIQPAPAEAAPERAFRTRSGYTGLEPVDLYISSIEEGKPAAKLQLRQGDKILGVGGRPIHSWQEFSRAIFESNDGPLALEVRQREGIRLVEFTPEVISQTNDFKQTTRKRGLGVGYERNYTPGRLIPRSNRLLHAFEMAFVDTGVSIYMNVVGFVRIFEGRVKATEAIGGPLMIASIAGKSAERGWRYFVKIMAMLSILLGLLNLLPIPILDGGHIAFILVEAALRRPVSITARVVASYVGLVLLVGLMVFALGNDLHRYWEDITSIFN